MLTPGSRPGMRGTATSTHAQSYDVPADGIRPA